jgi:acetamidase/formamidase
MTMAFDPDLDDCVVIALRNMIRLLGLWGGLNEHQAYALCSLVGDLRITQVVNGHKGVHLMMPREYFGNKPIFRKSDVRSGNRDQ